MSQIRRLYAFGWVIHRRPSDVLRAMHGSAVAIVGSSEAGPGVSGADPFEHDRLIEAVAQRRDRAAFARLFDYYAPRLKAFLMRSGASASAAEDFAQDAMLTVWRRADLFDARRAHAATWIFIIARNRRLDALRQEGRRALSGEDPLAPAEPERPDVAFEMAGEAERVRAAIANLAPDQAEAIRLSFFGDRPHAEIAAALHLPLGTVKSRIRAGLARLRAQLQNEEEAG